MGQTHHSANDNPFRALSPFSRAYKDLLDEMSWRLYRLDALYSPIVRAIRRTDLETDPGSGLVHPALITDVQPPTGPNANYSATAIADQSIFVTLISPINRILPVADVDWVAVAIGDNCLIFEGKDSLGEDELQLMVFEKVGHIFCTPSP